MMAKRDGAKHKLSGRLASSLTRRLHRFVGHQAEVVRGEDIEAIHDMRVSSRRLQEVAGLAAFVAGLKPDAVPGLAKVRKVRSALGRVRDLDVLVERLDKVKASLAPELRPHFDLLIERLTSQRESSLRKMRSRIGKLNLPKLLCRLEDGFAKRLVPAFAAKLNGSSRESDRQAVFKAVEDRIAARRAEFDDACEKVAEARIEDDFHAARIAGKKLRYLLEAADELKLGRFKADIKRLKGIQTTLGDWHDLVVLEEKLLAMCCDRAFAHDHLAAAGAVLSYLADQRTERQKLENRFVSQVRRRQRRAARSAEPDEPASEAPEAPAPDLSPPPEPTPAPAPIVPKEVLRSPCSPEAAKPAPGQTG